LAILGITIATCTRLALTGSPRDIVAGIACCAMVVRGSRSLCYACRTSRPTGCCGAGISLGRGGGPGRQRRIWIYASPIASKSITICLSAHRRNATTIWTTSVHVLFPRSTIADAAAACVGRTPPWRLLQADIGIDCASLFGVFCVHNGNLNMLLQQHCIICRRYFLHAV
jgi:hypothetical protein